MNTQENVVTEDSSESSIRNETTNKKTSDYKITSNNPLHDLIERQAKEFEEFGKRMSLDLQNFYKEYSIRHKGIIKAKNGPIEIEKICKEFEEKIVIQSQVIESLKTRIEELETDAIVKDQDIKNLRHEFSESLITISEQDNKSSNRRDSLTDQFSEILNMDTDSVSETNGDEAIFLHEIIETRSGTVLKCKKCEKTFKNHVRFMYHAKEKHQQKWLCLVCYQVFLSGRDRGIHMRKNHTKEFSCTLCTKECYDITGLREHFRAKHPGLKFPQNQQFAPSQSVPSQPSNSSQPSIPPRPSVPSQASTSATTQPIVGKFIHDIIPYNYPSNKIPPYQLKCKFCEEIFTTFSQFNKHARKIHGYKLLCIHCSQLFSQKGPRNRHMKEDHIYNCQVCNKALHSVEGLISHCKAKRHKMNMEETIHSIYSTLREIHSQDESLHDPNKDFKDLEQIFGLTNDDNVIKEDEESDNVKYEIEKDSGEDSDLFDSFDDTDDDTEENEDNGDNDADDGVNFPKCEECQLYFRDAKHLENHNKYHYQNIF